MEKNSSTTDALLRNLQEREREQSHIFSICNSLSGITGIDSFSDVVNQHFKAALHFEDFIICTTDEQEQQYQVFYQFVKHKATISESSTASYKVADGFFDSCMESADNVYFELASLIGKKHLLPEYMQKAYTAGIRHIIGIALPYQKKQPAILYLLFRQPDGLSRQAARLLKGIGIQLSITIVNIVQSQSWERQQQELALLRKRVEEQKHFPEQHKDKSGDFSGIIGSCVAMQKVFELISQVAYSGSNVLVLGETGTGKELIAGAIHDNSPFREEVMVKVNCAAIPAHLIESELFGHEKGSFTGATERRIGKFEQAHNSTIFLDEIGELPLELQAKMLRVLQEKEIERIGGNGSIKINVRIIAATNRNLETEVAEGRFRSDLYYRLNVYPIQIPALRDRMEDLPLLSNYFLDRHSQKTGKNITKFSHKALEGMLAYSWPGNIRELENLIERNILFAKGDTIKEIHFPQTDRNVIKNGEEEFYLQSLQEVEREHILRVVKKCNGRISGPYGAAVILDVPATTLISKMQKLGIKKSHLIDKKL